MECMCDLQVSLNKTESPSCVKEVEVLRALPLMGIVGKAGLHLRQLTTYVVLAWLNEIRLPLTNFSMTVKSLARRKAEVPL